jgi:hypothetical protein
MPTIIENPTSVQEQYSHHLVVDGANGVPASAVTNDFLENLLGHRSGVGNSTPWSAPPTRPLPGFYQDADSQGSGAAFAATTLTDAARAWGVGDFNLGGTVTYAAGTITDTARSVPWVVGNTAQYAGRVIRTITGKLGIIASAAANVLTLAANWQGGTPAAGEQYAFMPLGLVGRTIFAVGTGGAITKGVIIFHIGTIATITAWSNGTPAAGAAYIIGPDATPVVAAPKFNDNWWATLRQLYNPANL